ncbi:interleukin-2 like [Xyrichtys novacula]|uniref:Interleukin-2 like n=1 Tax=Xyrichtys novacula TaxID=13765 RepID=A0AAV1FD82_XYRNO|nr:interleukin-2 like [Xyrichtys novacula]
MEQCLRIALWMFFLLGYLQANPIPTDGTTQCSSQTGQHLHFNLGDLGFNFLHKEVTCEKKMTFTAPKNVEPICYTAALESFIKGLERAEASCTGDVDRVTDTLDAIRNSYPQNTKCPHPEQCKWESEEYLQQFEGFVKATEKFVKELNMAGNV